MKRILSICIAFAVLLSLTACGSSSEPQGTVAPTAQATDSTPAPTAPGTESVPETTEAAQQSNLEGFIYLTVSKITFSLAGESEDLYVGTIPRDQVTWGSMDESIVSFAGGIATAVAPGETMVYAEYAGQRIECTVGCLAQTQEELMTLDEDTLRSPKRLPPAVSDTPLTFYDDSAIIGDSITYILFQWQTQKGYLGNPQFMCRGGTGINGLALNYMPIYYQGMSMAVEDALLASGCRKVFIMLGQNDLSYMTIDETMDKWELLLERIRSKNPDLQIYFQSVIPEWFETGADNSKNEKIAAHNILLQEFAQENGCIYLDVARYAVDHLGKMPTSYSLDASIHLNEDGCMAWMQFFKAYAEYQALKGEKT